MKTRRDSGDVRRAKRAAQKAIHEEGGYVDVARQKFREGGGDLVTGTRRTCLPDAITHLLLSLGQVPSCG